MKIYCTNTGGYDWRKRREELNEEIREAKSRGATSTWSWPNWSGDQHISLDDYYTQEMFKVSLMKLAGKDIWALVTCKGTGISAKYEPSFIRVKSINPSGKSIIVDALSYLSCDRYGEFSQDDIKHDKWLGLGSVRPIGHYIRDIKDQTNWYAPFKHNWGGLTEMDDFLLLSSSELFGNYFRPDRKWYHDRKGLPDDDPAWDED